MPAGSARRKQLGDSEKLQRPGSAVREVILA
jgi:hypothetical protein